MNTNYYAKTIDENHDDLLQNISNDYEKQIGTFTSDLTKSFAIEEYSLAKKIELLFYKLDVENYEGDELTRFVFQRKGVVRKPASVSTGTLEVKGDGIVGVGALFETDFGTQFKAIEEVHIDTIGNVKVEAVIEGLDGNVTANQITFIPITISGITEVTNPNPTIDGFDVETDESLIERYLLEVQKPATSGNIYHYEQWAREVVGVGDAKIFPLWNGDNTVKIVIIDDEKKHANQELVDRVQNYIDPKGDSDITWGAGYGEAPIGAYCSVISATDVTLDVVSTITLDTGYTISSVQDEIESKFKEYLQSIAFKRNSISYAILGSLILDVEGVSDWSIFKINTGTVNINIGDEEVAVLGSVTLSV